MMFTWAITVFALVILIALLPYGVFTSSAVIPLAVLIGGVIGGMSSS